MDFMDTGIFWVSIGVMLFIMEILAPGFVLFFFGIGAWTVALINWLYPITLATQIVLFTLVSLVSLLVFRKTIQGKLFNAAEKDEVIEENVQVEVVEAIRPPKQGRVRYSGSLWLSEAEEEIEAGTTVTIVRRDNLVMHVKK